MVIHTIPQTFSKQVCHCKNMHIGEKKKEKMGIRTIKHSYTNCKITQGKFKYTNGDKKVIKLDEVKSGLNGYWVENGQTNRFK